MKVSVLSEYITIPDGRSVDLINEENVGITTAATRVVKVAGSKLRSCAVWLHANQRKKERCDDKPQSNAVHALRVLTASKIFVKQLQTNVFQAFGAGKGRAQLFCIPFSFFKIS